MGWASLESGRRFFDGFGLSLRPPPQPPISRIAPNASIQIRFRPPLDLLFLPLSSRSDVFVVSVGHFAVGSWVFVDFPRARLVLRLWHGRALVVVVILTPLLLSDSLALVSSDVCFRSREVDISLPDLVVTLRSRLALRVPGEILDFE